MSIPIYKASEMPEGWHGYAPQLFVLGEGNRFKVARISWTMGLEIVEFSDPEPVYFDTYEQALVYIKLIS